MGRCAEAIFSLAGKDEAECTEGVGVFNYIGRLLDQLGENWLEVLRNIRKESQVWGRLGKLLQREGAEPFVSELFWSIVQAVLLFRAETTVFSMEMGKTVEGLHVGFLQKVTIKTAM